MYLLSLERWHTLKIQDTQAAQLKTIGISFSLETDTCAFRRRPDGIDKLRWVYSEDIMLKNKDKIPFSILFLRSNK